MMCTVIVSEREGIVCMCICHRWVSMKLKFVLVLLVEKCEIQGQLRKQVSTWNFAHYWFM